MIFFSVSDSVSTDPLADAGVAGHAALDQQDVVRAQVGDEEVHELGRRVRVGGRRGHRDQHRGLQVLPGWPPTWFGTIVMPSSSVISFCIGDELVGVA